MVDYGATVAPLLPKVCEKAILIVQGCLSKRGSCYGNCDACKLLRCGHGCGGITAVHVGPVGGLPMDFPATGPAVRCRARSSRACPGALRGAAALPCGYAGD